MKLLGDVTNCKAVLLQKTRNADLFCFSCMVLMCFQFSHIELLCFHQLETTLYRETAQLVFPNIFNFTILVPFTCKQQKSIFYRNLAGNEFFTGEENRVANKGCIPRYAVRKKNNSKNNPSHPFVVGVSDPHSLLSPSHPLSQQRIAARSAVLCACDIAQLPRGIISRVHHCLLTRGK